MQFTQRQWMLMALFAIFWTAFMLVWNGDYGTARIATLLVDRRCHRAGVGLVDEEMGRVEGEGVRGVNGPMISARPREGGDPVTF